MKEIRLLLVAALLLIGSGRMMADWDQYPNYLGYENMMYQFGIDHPDKCEIITLGTLQSDRKLLVAHINNGSSAGKPKFLYTSTIHGDETTGWMLLLRLIDYLLENPEEPECRNVLDNIDLYICPNLNPDGTYNGGNNTVNGATRYNAQGMDMNRNYPDPHEGPHPDKNPYAPETEWMMAFAQQQRFTMAADFHGGAEVINYPWDNTYTLHADDAWFQMISHEYADLTHEVQENYMTDYQNGVTNGAQWYMIGGGLQDYLCGYTQCRAISIHCSYTKLPSPSQMPTFWYRNKESLFALMNQCLYGIHGKVIDAENNQPIEGATIRLMGHDDQYSTVSTYSDGFFHRPVKGGTYTLKITKHGYNPYEEEVTVADGEAVNINVALTPEEGITADFTADKTLVTVGMEVHFTDDTWGEQLTSWEWTFTGGTPETSTEQNPTVTYNTAGTYNVSLTVTNEKGETDTRIKEGYIKVLNAFNMHGGSESVSEEAFFCDDGGQKSNYSNNQDDTLTIYPATAGGTVLVTFQSFETEANCDYLEIYDGTTTDETTLVGSFSGDNNPGTMSATNPDGALTFRFYSDYSVNKSGWVAYVKQIVEGSEGNPPTSIARVHSGTTATTTPWFALDGRRLAKKPTAKGIYLYNGRKIIIK
jgi:PKD repeat protein